MKISNDTQTTICSIAITISLLLFFLGIHFGSQYLDEHYIKYDVKQMLNIYYEISDPVEKEGEDIIIDKRWICKICHWKAYILTTFNARWRKFLF